MDNTNSPSVEELHTSAKGEEAAQTYDNPAYSEDCENPPPEVVVVNGDSDIKDTPSAESAIAPATGDEVEVEKQKRRDREPLLFCKFISNRPKLSFALFLFGQVLFIIMTMLMIRAGYDIIPITFDRVPLDITDNVDYLRESAWKYRYENDDIITQADLVASPTTQRERSVSVEDIEMIFKSESGNVFTKDNMQRMQEVEEAFYNNAEYQKFCVKNAVGSCTKPTSVIRYFDGTYRAIDPIFDDPSFNNIPGVLYAASVNSDLNNDLQYHLGQDAEITRTEATSVVTRMYISIGGPLAGYANTSDNADEQHRELERFIFNTLNPIGDDYFSSGVGDMEFVYSSDTIISVTITSTVIKDMMLAFGSLAFIVIFMMLQTGSFWVSLFAVLSIISGFTIANMIYRVVLDYRYFGAFHVLALFIILGIGADDVFVFFDTWKETGHHKYKSLAHRMSDCYRKASFAMLFTSLTTAQAFIVSAASPFLGVSSFGVFAGLLVAVNYISVITFFPTVVIMYHLYFEKYKCCCCCVRPGYGVGSETQGATDDGNRKHALVRFFRGPFFNFVTHKIAKWCILAFYGVIFVLFTYFATTLEVNEEQIKFLKDSSNVGRFLSTRSLFSTRGTGEGPTVVLAWGLQEHDFSSCHHTNVSCTGQTVWDDSFSLSTPEAQRTILNLCQKIRTLPMERREELYIQTDLNTLQAEVDCFIQDLNADIQLPITRTTADTIVTRNQDYYDPLPAGFPYNFELGVSYWSSFLLDTDKRVKYRPYLGEARTDYTKVKDIEIANKVYPYMYGNRLRFVGISINTTLGFAMGYPTGLPVRDVWEEFVTTELASAPAALQGGFQCTPSGLWHWFKIQETLTSSAITGVAIGLCVALPLLILATHNVIVGILATLTICCITVCVVGVIPIAGWKLGVLESLNLVLVVGLSVDYVVHLAEGYSRSLHEDRLNRTRDMLEEVGISVLSGAFTTLGATVFMLAAEILFFVEFGVFMFATIGFSIFFALGLFVTIIAIIGPQKEFGSLKPLYRACARKCCKKGE